MVGGAALWGHSPVLPGLSELNGVEFIARSAALGCLDFWGLLLFRFVSFSQKAKKELKPEEMRIINYSFFFFFSLYFRKSFRL